MLLSYGGHRLHQVFVFADWALWVNCLTCWRCSPRTGRLLADEPLRQRLNIDGVSLFCALCFFYFRVLRRSARRAGSTRDFHFSSRGRALSCGHPKKLTVLYEHTCTGCDRLAAAPLPHRRGHRRRPPPRGSQRRRQATTIARDATPRPPRGPDAPHDAPRPRGGAPAGAASASHRR